MGDKRYDTQLPGAPATVEPRTMHPLEYAVMGAAAAAFIALGLGVLAERPLSELWRWLLVGAMVPMGALLIRSLAPIIVATAEELTRRDLSGDGVIGRPHPVLVNPRAGQEVARQQGEAEYKAAFEVFIRGCERDTSLRRWEERGVSRTQYQEWRDTLIGAGYAAWKNDQDQRQGWRLLLPAEQIIAEVWRA